MAVSRGELGAVFGVVGIFLAIQLGALALVQPFLDANVQAVEDPTNPQNSVLFFGVVLVATGIMLAAMRFGGDRVIRAVLILVSGSLVWMVTGPLLAPLTAVQTGSAGLNALAWGIGAIGPILASLLAMVGLFAYPEWYVVDATGIVMGAGAAALFGVSFGPFPAILFLLILAVYDAISVYGTKHMLTLAEGIMDLNVPVVLVVPTQAGYSFMHDEGPASTEAAEAADRPERNALYIGLGDAVMPSVLVASAATFHPEVGALSVPGLAVNVPALGAIIGTTAGLFALMWLVLKGRPHAGLPLLNGGAITGYLVASVAAGLTLVEAIGWPF